MSADVSDWVKNCLSCQDVNGSYITTNPKQGSIVGDNVLYLLHVDFTKMNLRQDSKENVLILTNASQNQLL